MTVFIICLFFCKNPFFKRRLWNVYHVVNNLWKNLYLMCIPYAKMVHFYIVHRNISGIIIKGRFSIKRLEMLAWAAKFSPRSYRIIASTFVTTLKFYLAWKPVKRFRVKRYAACVKCAIIPIHKISDVKVMLCALSVDFLLDGLCT